MINTAAKIFQKPYPFYFEFTKNLQYILAFSIFIPLLLIILQPFGLSNVKLYNENLKLMGFGIVAFIVLSCNFFFLPRAFPKLFHSKNWNLGKEIIWEIWNYVIFVQIGTIYWAEVLDYRINVQTFTGMMRVASLLAIFLIPFCATVNYITRIKDHLRKVEENSRKLKGETQLELISETGRQKVKVQLKDLLYIRSCDNYAKIVIRNSGETNQILLRSSLKGIENQLSVPFVIRCHRSFIVNLEKVGSTRGNVREFVLELETDSKLIPVSRKSIPRIKKLLNDLG